MSRYFLFFFYFYFNEERLQLAMIFPRVKFKSERREIIVRVKNYVSTTQNFNFVSVLIISKCISALCGIVSIDNLNS